MLLIILSILINISYSSPVDSCDLQAPCLQISYDFDTFGESDEVNICIVFDSTFPECVKGGLPEDGVIEESEPISHACYNGVEEDKKEDYDPNQDANDDPMCIRAPCDAEDVDRFVKFGFKDGKQQCKTEGTETVFIDGVEYGLGEDENGVECLAADEDVEGGILCGGGQHGECIYSVPYQCPEPTTPSEFNIEDCLEDKYSKDATNDEILAYCNCKRDAYDDNEGIDVNIRLCECFGMEPGEDQRECTCLKKGEQGGGGCSSNEEGELSTQCNNAGGNPCTSIGNCCCSIYQNTIEDDGINFCVPEDGCYIENRCNFDEDSIVTSDDYDGEFDEYIDGEGATDNMMLSNDEKSNSNGLLTESSKSIGGGFTVGQLVIFIICGVVLLSAVGIAVYSYFKIQRKTAVAVDDVNNMVDLNEKDDDVDVDVDVDDETQQITKD